MQPKPLTLLSAATVALAAGLGAHAADTVKLFQKKVDKGGDTEPKS
ncbi:MAG TPA: hypothetical protein VES00_13160 [Burkholderiaceae bacterium]|jgi:hypothetical protein|nr:hypothetical protein [Burkholderiaceae bacterium]